MEHKKLTVEQLNKMDKTELISKIMTMQKEVEEIGSQLNFLTEQLALLNQRHFGKSSEKSQIGGQISLFNEAESFKDHSPEPAITEVVISSYKRSKKKGQRELDLDGLPARVFHHELTKEELDEIFPGGYKELPDEIYKRLSVIPQTFMVDEHHVHKYASKDNSGEIIRADRPADVFRNSLATPSLLALILDAKYRNATPIERQVSVFRSYGLNLKSNTLSNWCIKSSELYFSMLFDRLHKEFYNDRYEVANADETYLEVNRDGRPAGSKSYMWVYRTQDKNGKYPVILYDYQKTRKTDHPREFLKNFSGTVVTDGYQVYHKLEKERDDLKVAGCWVHARRKFSEILKSDTQKVLHRTIAKEAEERITKMMALDNTLDDLSKTEREKQRKKLIAKDVDDYFEWVKETYPTLPSESSTAKALAYSINQEKYLRVFLTDGSVPMDNNAAERAIRPFTLGRKNWVMIDSVNGAKASAVIYSIVETAKANGLRVYDYLEHLLTEMPKHQKETDLSFIEDLLPWSPIVQEKFHVIEKKS